MADPQVSLFDATAYRIDPPEPAPALSPDRRRTIRQAAMLAAGWHPLGPTAGHLKLALHPDAAPHNDRTAPGRRCGTCWYRRVISTGSARAWPKCLYGDVNPTDAAPRPGPPPRVSRGPGTDCRSWWSACVDHTYGEPSLSDDAARWVPDGGDRG